MLILREVLGFSAKETAEMLDTTVASVNSALQRARAAVEERVPERTQQATLRALEDGNIAEIVDRYVDAWERCDVDAFAAMLAQDATFAMPPLSTWYSTRDGDRDLGSCLLPVGRVALEDGPHARERPAGARVLRLGRAVPAPYLPFALNVLSFRGSLISNVTAFIVRSTEEDDPEAYVRFPDQPIDERTLAGTFERFGVPDRLSQAAADDEHAL